MPIDDPDLRCEPMVSSGSVSVLLADHPLAAHEVLTPERLRGQPLILLGSGRQWRAQVDQSFARYSLRPTVAVETHTHGSACALASRGVGIAIVNALLARSYVDAPLVTRRFEPEIQHDYAFVTSALSHPSRLTVALREKALAFGASAAAG